jgi:exonuclease VII large subunit
MPDDEELAVENDEQMYAYLLNEATTQAQNLKSEVDRQDHNLRRLQSELDSARERYQRRLERLDSLVDRLACALLAQEEDDEFEVPVTERTLTQEWKTMRGDAWEDVYEDWQRQPRPMGVPS